MAITPQKKSAKEKPKKKIAASKSSASKKARIAMAKKPTAVKVVAKKKPKVPAKKKMTKRVPARKRKASAPAIKKPAVRKTVAHRSRAIKPLIPKNAASLEGGGLKVSSPQKRLLPVPKMTRSREKLSAAPVESRGAQPVRASFFREAHGSLPAGYGDHFIALMICSPYQLYAYWEIQKQRESEALRILGGSWNQVKTVLRVYDLTRNAVGLVFFDLEISGDADRWFMSVEPDQSYRVEIGLRHDDGRFIMLARSNDVTTPRVTMSEVLDEEWAGINFERIYALSGGFEPGCSSMELRALMEKRLRSGETSGSGAGMISSGSLVKKERSFWFKLDCELIVHGATAPDAQVTMNGQAVQLRPDGTFTLRYALPDGAIRLEAKAVSADLIEERSITPTVQRNTERLEPVIRPPRGRG